MNKLQQETIKPDDILVSSWGYYQTNINYYKVLRVTSSFVTIVCLENTYLPKTSEYVDLVIPSTELNKYHYTGALRRKVHNTSYGTRVYISNYESTRIWDNKPREQTDSRFGR